MYIYYVAVYSMCNHANGNNYIKSISNFVVHITIQVKPPTHLYNVPCYGLCTFPVVRRVLVCTNNNNKNGKGYS